MVSRLRASATFLHSTCGFRWHWQSGIKKKTIYTLHVYHFMAELTLSSFEGLQMQLGSTETYFFSRYQVMVGFVIVDWRWNIKVVSYSWYLHQIYYYFYLQPSFFSFFFLSRRSRHSNWIEPNHVNLHRELVFCETLCATNHVCVPIWLIWHLIEDKNSINYKFSSPNTYAKRMGSRYVSGEIGVEDIDAFFSLGNSLNSVKTIVRQTPSAVVDSRTRQPIKHTWVLR